MIPTIRLCTTTTTTKIIIINPLTNNNNSEKNDMKEKNTNMRQTKQTSPHPSLKEVSLSSFFFCIENVGFFTILLQNKV